MQGRPREGSGLYLLILRSLHITHITNTATNRQEHFFFFFDCCRKKFSIMRVFWFETGTRHVDYNAYTGVRTCKCMHAHTETSQLLGSFENASQALCLLDTLMAMIDNVLLTLFKIFKQDGSLLTCILHYHVNSSHISVMSAHFVPYKLN